MTAKKTASADADKQVRDRDWCFEPKEEFPWFREDAVGQRFLVALYSPGQEYTCTTQAKHDELFEKLQEWSAEGKVIIYPRSASKRKNRIVAQGKVTDGGKE
jgi:hypothetical protein